MHNRISITSNNYFISLSFLLLLLLVILIIIVSAISINLSDDGCIEFSPVGRVDHFCNKNNADFIDQQGVVIDKIECNFDKTEKRHEINDSRSNRADGDALEILPGDIHPNIRNPKSLYDYNWFKGDIEVTLRDKISGYIVDDCGLPFNNIQVSLLFINSPPLYKRVGSCTSDENGCFSFDNVIFGNILTLQNKLTLQNELRNIAYYVHIVLPGKEKFISSPISSPQKGYKIILYPECILFGYVFHQEDNNPVGNKWIKLEKINNKRSFMVDDGSCSSMQDGAFQVSNLSPGTYKFIVEDFIWIDPIKIKIVRGINRVNLFVR